MAFSIDSIWDDVSDFAETAIDSIKTAGTEAINDRLVGTDKSEPQNYVTGSPGVDVSNAPQSVASNNIMGFTPAQLGLGAFLLLGTVFLVKKVT